MIEPTLNALNYGTEQRNKVQAGGENVELVDLKIANGNLWYKLYLYSKITF
jgi:hypothetical protein